jgi:hypothetical protein
MPKTRASFRDFLMTGVLGPLSIDMKLIDVARTLGAPNHFLTPPATQDVPSYWFYGRFLEVCFDISAPHRVEFFQLNRASLLEGKKKTLFKDIDLILDGFSAETKPSEFLSSDLWDIDNTCVSINPSVDEIWFNICASKVSIYFFIDTSFLPDDDAERFLATNNLSEAIKIIDNHTSLRSITSLPDADKNRTYSSFGYAVSISGSEYLDAIKS